MSPQVINSNELLQLADCLDALGLRRYEGDFLALFEVLDFSERRVLLDLIPSFEVCEIDRYPSLADELVAGFMPLLKDADRRVVCLPLLDPAKRRKPKSGDAVLWLASRMLERAIRGTGRAFELSSGALTGANIGDCSKTIYFMVDDFIGTGETAGKALNALHASGVPFEKIVVGCFVGMKTGYRAVAKTGAGTVFLKTIERGISDSTVVQDKEAALKTMEAIERRNKVAKDYRFGFQKSEALALMCFCPNNTFPIFWWDGPAWVGPFQR